jgi:ribosome-binding factor A
MAKRTTKKPGQRPLRVGEELRHVLAQILERDELRDPDLTGVVVTVTEVRMSPDLRNATVFVSPLGGTDSEKIVAALKRAAPYLRRRIAVLVKLRYAPNLRIELDTSFDYAELIGRRLAEVVPSDEFETDDDEDDGDDTRDETAPDAAKRDEDGR